MLNIRDGHCLTIFYNLQRYKLPVFGSCGFSTPTAMETWENSICVHFEMTFLTTLTGTFDFANLIFQAGIFSKFKLGKNSNWIFQTGECQKKS